MEKLLNALLKPDENQSAPFLLAERYANSLAKGQIRDRWLGKAACQCQAGAAQRAGGCDLAVTAPDATAEQWQSLREALGEAPIVFDVDLLRINDANPQTLRAKFSHEGKDLLNP